MLFDYERSESVAKTPQPNPPRFYRRYGLAPTEIIYRIVVSYILGFDETKDISEHNLRLADALPYAKQGKLQELLDTLFPDKEAV